MFAVESAILYQKVYRLKFLVQQKYKCLQFLLIILPFVDASSLHNDIWPNPFVGETVSGKNKEWNDHDTYDVGLKKANP